MAAAGPAIVTMVPLSRLPEAKVPVYHPWISAVVILEPEIAEFHDATGFFFPRLWGRELTRLPLTHVMLYLCIPRFPILLSSSGEGHFETFVSPSSKDDADLTRLPGAV